MSTTAEQERVKRKALIAEIIDAYEHHADDSQSFREEARELLIAHEDEYFKTVVTSLAEEAEREARTIHETARRDIPHAPFASAYDAATRDAQHLEFAVRWLRQKAEEC
jgi:hypothetical protein